MAEESAREDAARRRISSLPTATWKSSPPQDRLKAQRICEERDRSRVEKLTAQMASREVKVKEIIAERLGVIEKRRAQNAIRYAPAYGGEFMLSHYLACSSILKMRGRDTTKNMKGNPSCSFNSF